MCFGRSCYPDTDWGTSSRRSPSLLPIWQGRECLFCSTCCGSSRYPWLLRIAFWALYPMRRSAAPFCHNVCRVSMLKLLGIDVTSSCQGLVSDSKVCFLLLSFDLISLLQDPLACCLLSCDVVSLLFIRLAVAASTFLACRSLLNFSSSLCRRIFAPWLLVHSLGLFQQLY